MIHLSSLIYFTYLFLVMGIFICVSVCACRGQQKVSDLLEPELQVVVSPSCGCLKLNCKPLEEPGILNHCGICLAPKHLILSRLGGEAWPWDMVDQNTQISRSIAVTYWGILT